MLNKKFIGFGIGKRGQSLAITLFVFFVVLVLGIALFYFVTQKSSQDEEYYGASLDKLYFREKQIDVALENIFYYALKESNSEEEFIKKSKELMSYYNFESYSSEEQGQIYVDVFPDFSNLIEEINPDNVEFNIQEYGVKKVSVSFDSFIEEDISNYYGETSLVGASKLYKKVFVVEYY